MRKNKLIRIIYIHSDKQDGRGWLVYNPNLKFYIGKTGKFSETERNNAFLFKSADDAIEQLRGSGYLESSWCFPS